MYHAVVLASEMYTHLVPDRRIRATIKPTLGERNQDQYVDGNQRTISKSTRPSLTASGDTTSSPTLILSGPRRKQCPLYSVNSESSLLGCAGNDRYSKDWSPSFLKARQHKPNDSARVGTGQSSRRGRVRCLTHFIAWERRRCEPGSNSVIVTASFTGCEGHVAGPGGLQRTRKIFVGCPAIRPIRDQSPGRTASRFETVGNRLYPIHGQIRLCRYAAEAQIQDRSRKSTGLNTAPGFLRVKCPFREAKGARKRSDRGGCPRTLPRLSRGGGNPEKNKARHPPTSFPRTREPREKQSTPPIHSIIPSPSMGEG